MKNSITNMWLLSLVVIFIFIFSAYLAITVNYSMAFKIKNEVLDIIEKRKGIQIANGDAVVTQPSKITGGNVKVPKSALGVINVYLTSSGYKTLGKCSAYGDGGSADTEWYGVRSLTDSDGPVLSIDNPDVVKNSNSKYY